MDSEDDVSNLSGRHETSGRHVHYFDSSIASSSSESSEMDKYLDEAIENEEDDVIVDNHRRDKGNVSDEFKSFGISISCEIFGRM